MNLEIENIRLINPYTDTDSIVNIIIHNGIIQQIGPDVKLPKLSDKINGEGLVISPGLIDIHVHLREPGYEYKETIKTGTDSAANGGFTAVVCMPNTNPDIDNIEVINYIKEKARGLAVDVLISAAITQKRKGQELTDMNELHQHGVVLFTDDGAPVDRADIMSFAFEYAKEKDLILSQHCEESSLTSNFVMNESVVSQKLGLPGYPNIAEEITLFRDVKLAEHHGNRRYHAQHLSTAGAVEIIRNAKSKGLRVTCEVTPHHFILEDTNLESLSSDYKMNPPLRRGNDIQKIIEGIKDGTIDCIATDHAPHSIEEKSRELHKTPNGIIGLETALGLSMTFLVHKGLISINDLIKLMSVNPRNILNLEPINFEIGDKINATIFDPNDVWTVNKDLFRSKSRNTPFNNYKLKGKPKYILNNNKLVKCEL
ncbi:dihydroorotase [Candidatus Kapaibacterium sp.]